MTHLLQPTLPPCDHQPRYIFDDVAEVILGETLYNEYYQYDGALVYYGPMALKYARSHILH